MGNMHDRKTVSGDPTRPSRVTHVYPALAAFAAVAVYVNCLGNGFVYDDTVQVVKNYWMTDAGYLGDVFTSGVWGFAGLKTSYYRPMMHVIYMAAWHMFGPGPWGFHVVSVVLHASVSVAVYYLLAGLLVRSGVESGRAGTAALGGALLFAVHPVHTEAVCWAAGVPDLSYALFFILSVHTYLVPQDGTAKSRAYRFVSVAAFFLAALSKEPALTLPGVLVACDYSSGAFKNGTFRRHLIRYTPYVLVMAVYMSLRLNALGSFAPNVSHAGLTGLQAVAGAVVLLAGYLRLLVLPFGLSGFHEFRPVSGILDPVFIAAGVAACAFAAASWFGARKYRLLLPAAAIAVLPLLPALYIPALGNSPLAERYLYLPTVGFSLVVSLMLVRAGEYGAFVRKASLVAVTAAIAIFAAGTIARNPVWKDNISFWSDASVKSPDSAYPQNALGLELMDAGRTEEAARCFTRAIELDAGFDEPYVNLGNYYNAEGALDRAEDNYRKALDINSKNSNALNNLGVVMARQGKLEEALQMFEAAVSADRYHAEAYENMARAYRKLGMPDRERAALELLKSVTAENPASARDRMIVRGKGDG